MSPSAASRRNEDGTSVPQRSDNARNAAAVAAEERLKAVSIYYHSETFKDLDTESVCVFIGTGSRC